jgi:hypothetical protein
MINKRTDLTEVQMIEESRAYYLIKGAIVQVVLEDAAAGMSRIHSPEIGSDVWTLTRFLSKRPVRSPDGEIEVPGRSVWPRTHENQGDLRDRGSADHKTSTFAALNPLYRKLWFAVLLVSMNTGPGNCDFLVS